MKGSARSLEDYNVKPMDVVLQGWAHNFIFKNNILHEYLQALHEDVMLKLYSPLSI